MRNALPGVALVLLGAAPIGAAPEGIPLNANLVANPGFEQDAEGWSFDASKWQVVDGVAYSGTHSLRITNDDKKSYTLTTAPIPCASRRAYRFSVRIKTENVAGEDSGAAIALEWFDKDHKWLGGSYRKGVTGTNDWTLISAESSFTPADAAYMSVVLYLRPGCTGTAWFDDVSVELTDKDTELVFRPLIRYPNYRETMYAGAPRKLDVGVELEGNRKHPTDGLTVDVAVVDAQDKVIASAKKPAGSAKAWVDISFGLKKAPPGEYRAWVKLLNKSGQQLDKRDLPFRIAENRAPRPKVYIDEHNRCVVDGKLFFPLGLYVGENPAVAEAVKDLDRLAASKFNCLMMYGVNASSVAEIKGYLDAIDSRGLRIIYAIQSLYKGLPQENTRLGEWTGAEEVYRGLVTTFKDHPAVMAWYLNDELTDKYLPQLADHYAMVRKMDPNHPIWQVLYLGQPTKQHVASTDVLGIDFYPVCAKTADPDVAGFARATVDVWNAVMGARGMWMVPQASSLEAYQPDSDCRQPTFQEALCMPCLGLIHGARGLIFYSLFDIKRTKGGEEQWNVMKRVAEEIERLKPIVLGLDVPAERRVSVDNEAIHVLTRDVEGGIRVLAANPSHKPVKATYKLGPSLDCAKVEISAPGAATRSTAVSKGTFADEIEPCGVRVYELVK